MPWRGPLGGDPLDRLPGPGNPWLACAGEGSALDQARTNSPTNSPTNASGDNALKLPEFALLEENPIAIDWNKIAAGMGLNVSGVLVIIAGIVGGVAVAATLPATGVGIAASVLVSSVAITMAAGGSILMAAGGATMIGGIDPKITDYKKHVAAIPSRKLALPADLPAPVLKFMQSVTEIERLSTAETDIIDHARAAAKAKDKSWTELHLRDLYHVQNAKQHYVSSLSEALGAINVAFGKDFDQHRVDPQEPVRDLINPLIEMRASLNEVANLSNAEINAVLAAVRIPSPTSAAIEETVQVVAQKAGGQPSEMINMAAEQLERLNVIDHEAFGLKR